MTVHFIGAGPGDPDLITVKGLRLIQTCKTCLYAGSLVPPAIVEAAPEDAHVVDTAPLALDEIITEIVAANDRGEPLFLLGSRREPLQDTASQHDVGEVGFNDQTATELLHQQHRFQRSAVQAAVGVWTASLWIVLLVPASLVGVWWLAVRHEEAYLEAKFGDEYLAYKRSVRRWL